MTFIPTNSRSCILKTLEGIWKTAEETNKLRGQGSNMSVEERFYNMLDINLVLALAISELVEVLRHEQWPNSTDPHKAVEPD